jgi:FKBP-type peptidyl-prolyl cis-trans isomerase
MRRFATVAIVATAAIAAAACQRAKDDKTKDQKTATTKRVDTGSGSAQAVSAKGEQVVPPVDLKNPPADAVKLPSGLIFKKLVANDAGVAPKRNDTVMINYTEWRQSTGETFYSTKSRGQPVPLNLGSQPKSFAEGFMMMKQGEKVVMWVPPSLRQREGAPPPTGADTSIFEVELASIQPAPEVPADKEPPANAQAFKSGTKYVVLRPGTGTAKARNFDTVTFNYTFWDNEGRQLDSSEARKRPAKAQPFRQPAVLEEVLTSVPVGQRVRFWIAADKVLPGKNQPGMPTGTVVYELEVNEIEKGTTPPPPVPPDVAKPPAGTKSCGKNILYKVLKAGKGGPKPKATDTVRVHYTGWTTDGRMFDSSIIRNEPAEFSLGGVIQGWTDGLQEMSVGDKFRFWIPEDQAYKGAAGKPAGMLVFDVELLEIKAPSTDPHGAHGEDDGHGHGSKPGGIPAPPDVAAPPKDAKKSPKGVSYKVLTAGKGGPKPSATDTVRVHYTGWTTDGKMFDSSVQRGEPAEFPLNGVIAGWTDGLQLMSAGDKFRFWIPVDLAYQNRPGRPAGTLVFDVELLEIKPPSASPH